MVSTHEKKLWRGWAVTLPRQERLALRSPPNPRRMSNTTQATPPTQASTWRSQDWWGARRMSRGGRKEPMQKAVQISIFPQRCQVKVESNLCFYNFKILQSNLKLKLRSRRNCNEVIPKLSQPLELNKGDPEANSKSLFFSEEMKASRMLEEKERRSYAGRHLMSICRCS